MNALFKHILLTEFNIKADDDPGYRLDTKWLDHRFRLFEQYCLPSVKGQSNHDFTWLVLFDRRTAAPYRTRIENHASWRNLVPLYLDDDWEDTFCDEVRRHLPEGATHLITSRLDNDDALSRDFIKTIQDSFRGQDREVMIFPRGYVLSGGRLYLFEYPNNPFATLVERIDGFRTVFCADHDLLRQVAPVLDLPGRPSWLQVVHDRNLTNKVRGVRLWRSPASLRDEFSLEAPLEDAQESNLEFLIDYLGSLRWSAQSLRATARRLIK